jgi:hypothetical protein
MTQQTKRIAVNFGGGYTRRTHADDERAGNVIDRMRRRLEQPTLDPE